MMKLKYLSLLIFILIFSCGISFAGENFDVAGHAFDVPDGYSVNQSGENATTLICDNSTNYSIFVSAGDIVDLDTAKSSRQVAGFRFLGEDNYTTENDVLVFQENYVKNESFFSYYSFDIDGNSYLITYRFPVDDTVSDGKNPVDVIIESCD